MASALLTAWAEVQSLTDELIGVLLESLLHGKVLSDPLPEFEVWKEAAYAYELECAERGLQIDEMAEARQDVERLMDLVLAKQR